jgi:hypothetical protein
MHEPYQPKRGGLVDFMNRDAAKTDLDRLVDRLAVATWCQKGGDAHNITVSEWRRDGDWVHAAMYRISLYEGDDEGVLRFPAELLDARRDDRKPRVPAAVALAWAQDINPGNPFVQSCAQHLARKGFLSPGQITALCQVDYRRGIIPRRRRRRQ